MPTGDPCTCSSPLSWRTIHGDGWCTIHGDGKGRPWPTIGYTEPAPTARLHPDDLEAIARRVAELLRAP